MKIDSFVICELIVLLINHLACDELDLSGFKAMIHQFNLQ
jgi:hypothetical protein